MSLTGFGELQNLISITHDGRTLQMRPDQLTVSVLSVAFRLIPETMFLVSERGTIAVAVDGVFSDVDDLYDWSVEGEKSSGGRTSVSTISMTSAVQQSLTGAQNLLVGNLHFSQAVLQYL